MTAVVRRAGYATSVQDAGRFGHRHEAVSSAGAMDGVALRVANALVGNDPGAAVLETCGGLEVQLTDARRVAFTGDALATIDGIRVAPWSSVCARAGACIAIATSPRSARSLLAVDGGVDVPLVLGSRSTDVLGEFGGYAGRLLRAGDELPLGAPRSLSAAVVQVQPPSFVFDPSVVRVLRGPEADDSFEAFCERSWRVSVDSSRIGCRLEGDALRAAISGTLRSHGVFPGVVQLPPSGEPIVLLADAQTTGGYARLAVVIHADLWKFAALHPGASVKFVPCTVDEARVASDALERYMLAVEASVRERVS